MDIKRIETTDQEARRLADESAYIGQKPSDTEMLNWLQMNTKGYGLGWVCRNSDHGRGLRLHETSRKGAKAIVRDAIAEAMKSGL